MAWADKVAATQLTSITTEQFFTFSGNGFIKLNPGELADIQVDVNFPATPTDDAVISLYGTLDDASENWDDTPFMQFTVSKSPDPDAVSFTVTGKYKFRIGVKRSGTTDTITSADCAYRKDGVNA